MAGLGQADQPLVSVPQAPLVTPATPTSQDAVSAMVDAFRKGFVTSQDIVDRIGVVGQAKDKALLESLGEHVSPEAIQARMEGFRAARDRAAIESAQAQANLPLVQPQAELNAAKIGSETASVNYGPTGLAAFQQSAPWFGESADDYKLPGGQRDFGAMARRGNEIAAQMNIANSWIEQLTPVSKRTVTDASGNVFEQDLNKWGVDVTPPNPQSGFHGSDAYWGYVDQLKPVLPKFHPLRGKFLMNPTGSKDEVPGRPAGADHLVQPLVTPEDAAQKRAALVESGMPVQQALTVPDSDFQNTVAPAVTPAVTPVVNPVVPAAAKALGIPVKAAPGNAWNEQDARASLEKAEPYKDWQATTKNIGAFESNARQIETLTPAQQRSRNLNVADIGLAESLIKMYDPTGVIREFKWEKFEKNQPLLSKLKNVQSAVLGNGSFTPETRKELIKMGYDIIKEREKAALPHLELAAKRIGSNPNANLENVLTEDDKRVLAQKFTMPSASSGANIPAGARIVNIPGKGRGYITNGNQFTPIP